MDRAVALVQAYLQVNGYFTVAEYPLLEASSHSQWRSATDLDLLAFRFAEAGYAPEEETHPPNRGTLADTPDPALGLPPASVDMIVGEVKEGRVDLNPAVRDQDILAAALRRFGCCQPGESDQVTQALLQSGATHTSRGHRIRIIAFGARSAGRVKPVERIIRTGHIVAFLRNHLDRHWQAFRQAQFKNEALGFLAMLEKAERGRPTKEEPS